MTEKWIIAAKELGFYEAAPLDVKTLNPEQSVREMCAENKCGAYGKNWTCPPACGSLEQCAETIQKYHSGILLQTVGQMKKRIDYKAIVSTEQKHLRLFYQFCAQIHREYTNALCLGAGGCRICGQCAYPEECRYPERAVSSMEAYGLFVTQVCRDNGILYYHGEKTITYTSCVLFN